MNNQPKNYRDHPTEIDNNGWIINGLEIIPSPNFDSRPAQTEISLLVIHNISLPPGQFGGQHIPDFFCNRLNSNEHPYFAQIENIKVSAHFLLGRNGEMIQFVSVLERAWHAGVSEFCGHSRCNDFSIGIELEGTDSIPYEQRQYERLGQLTNCIMRAFPAITTDRVVGHSDIAPNRKTDPGPAFDWRQFKQLIG